MYEQNVHERFSSTAYKGSQNLVKAPVILFNNIYLKRISSPDATGPKTNVSRTASATRSGRGSS